MRLSKIIAVVAGAFLASSCGESCDGGIEEHWVPVGTSIEHFGALPCKLTSAAPEGVVETEVIEAHLMGKAEGIDPTTVRLKARRKATAHVQCNGSKHRIEFVEAREVSIETPSASELRSGEIIRFSLMAFDDHHHELGMRGVESGEVQWTVSGPIEEPPSQPHSSFPGPGPHERVWKITGPGKIMVSASWRGLSSKTEVDAK